MSVTKFQCRQFINIFLGQMFNNDPQFFSRGAQSLKLGSKSKVLRKFAEFGLEFYFFIIAFFQQKLNIEFSAWWSWLQFFLHFCCKNFSQMWMKLTKKATCRIFLHFLLHFTSTFYFFAIFLATRISRQAIFLTSISFQKN